MNIKLKLSLAGKEIFEASLLTYLALLFAESIKPGVVSYFFNLNYLLAVVTVSGVLMVLFEPQIIRKEISKVTNKAKILRQRLKKRRLVDGIR